MQEPQEMQVPPLGGEDPLEEEMAAYSSILAWEIPWTEEPDGLQSMGSQRVLHDCATKHQNNSPALFFYKQEKWRPVRLSAFS